MLDMIMLLSQHATNKSLRSYNNLLTGYAGITIILLSKAYWPGQISSYNLH
jgi:hypothetical protein